MLHLTTLIFSMRWARFFMYSHLSVKIHISLGLMGPFPGFSFLCKFAPQFFHGFLGTNIMSYGKGGRVQLRSAQKLSSQNGTNPRVL